MFRMSNCISTLVLLLLTGLVNAEELDPKVVIEKAMNHWRGLNSHSEMRMTIHRPDWERTMVMQSWTKGDKMSLVRVQEPKKDAGNATLLNDNTMWTFSPKVNRVLKIPSSMMNQSWMGSDFSNKDISKSTDIIEQYDHRLLGTSTHEGHVVYQIESIPHEEAAVVWGKEVLFIRDDFVMLEQQFWDQDGQLVKVMKTLTIAEMGGRVLAKLMRIGKVAAPDEWTELEINAADFSIELKDSWFTLSNLRNPRKQ